MQDSLKQEFIAELLAAKKAGADPEVLAGLLRKYQDLGLQVRSEPVKPIPSASLVTWLTQQLSAQVAKVLRLPVAQLDVQGELTAQGMNSVYVIELVDAINSLLSLDLKPSVYFAHSRLPSLVNHLISEHPHAVQAAFAFATGSNSRPQISSAPPAPQPRASVQPRSANRSAAEEPLAIAVVGMSCQLPGSPDLDSFWQNLLAMRDGMGEVPADRWNWQMVAQSLGPVATETAKSACRFGGFIEDVDCFDADFFGLSPREAQYMDPQQRLFLQAVWKCIEHAGYNPYDLAGSQTGVYVGVATQDYGELLARSRSKIEPYMGTGLCHSILVNRISYFFDFKGPSQAIDTACSSSLVALHKACSDIASGQCQAAIVGGVNLMLSPSWHIALSQAGMLSPTGHCHSFSATADGYGRSEGLGALLLKPLAQAELDGDHIWGVIRGVAQNHGGRTSSLTAPSPDAQAQLLVESFRQAQFHPSTIGYIEAHGTGTKLGDPIEVQGLVKAFGELAKGGKPLAQGYCAIGSAKSSIGHLETAAGVAGVIKTLLCFERGQLPGNALLQEQNPFLAVDQSPFYLLDAARVWQPLQDEQGRELPRRAGVSSFGFGGVNAHVALEEYPKSFAEDLESGPLCWIFSARNAEQLYVQLESFIGYLQQARRDGQRLRPAAMAYTLQVGRAPMAARFACVCQSINQLLAKLKAVVVRNPDAEDYLNLADGSETTAMDMINSLNPHNALVADLFAAGDWHRVAKLWAWGLNINWAAYYASLPSLLERLSRVPLPTYVFAKARHWAADLAPVTSLFAPTVPPLHPLLQENVSTLEGQKFASRLLPFDFYLRDHQVAGKPLLPGVAYLEMAYVGAVASAAGEKVAGMRHIVWRSPLFVTAPSQCQLSFEMLDEGIGFTLAGEGQPGEGSSVYAQGQIDLGDWSELPAAIDIDGVIQRCQQQLESAELYAQFARMGIVYGPSFRLIKQIHFQDDEALAEFTLPAHYHPEAQAFQLHPAIMDTALQAAIAFIDPDQIRPMVPFTLAQLSVYGALPKTGYIYLQRTPTSGGRLQLDIQILDSEGVVSVSFSQFVARQLKDPLDNLYYLPSWQKAEAEPLAPTVEGPILLLTQPASQHYAAAIGAQLGDVYCLEFNPQLAANSKNCVSASHWQIASDGQEMAACLAQWPKPRLVLVLNGWLEQIPDVSDSAFADTYRQLAPLGLFRFIKAAHALGWFESALDVTTVLPNAFAMGEGQTVNPWPSSLVGLTLSLDKEYPALRARVINLCTTTGDAIDLPAYLPRILAEGSDEPVVSLTERGRSIRRLIPIQLPPVSSKQTIANTWPSAFRTNGHYLIVGGAGGIGLELASYLAATYAANITIIGRSPQDNALEQRLDRIRRAGGNWAYFAADALDSEALAQAVGAARIRFGELHGAVHSALLLRDQSLARMDEATFAAAFDPKYLASLNLYNALVDHPLDFLLLLSSAQSFWGNAGQGNYASGCTFKDGLASHLAAEAPFAVRVINWGYWSQVGVVSGKNYQNLMAKAGIGAVSIDEGMATIERSLAGYLPQIVAMRGSQASLLSMGVALAPTLLASSRLPSRLPPKAALSATEALLPTLQNTPRLMLEAEGFAAMERLGTQALLCVLQEAGLFADERAISADQIAERLGVIPKLKRLFDGLLFILVSNQWLVKDDLGVRRSSQELGPWPGLTQAYHNLAAQFPDLAPHCELSRLCLHNLCDILSGQKLATDVIFPEGKMVNVEGIYKGACLPDFCNQLIAQLVVQQAKLLLSNGQTQVRILEVGSGTGGTTAFVLPALKALGAQVEYTYSDVSRGFLSHGRNRFGQDYPFVRFALFDLEKSPLSQDFKPGQMDIAFGSNVIHATSNIGQTLSNLKQTLCRDGMLLINEVTAFQTFATLTFGMLDGWWLYDDLSARVAHSPLLSFDSWQHQLQEQGFYQTGTLGQGDQIQHNYYQQGVVLGYSDGIIQTQAEPDAVIEDDAIADLGQPPLQAQQPLQHTLPADASTPKLVEVKPGPVAAKTPNAHSTKSGLVAALIALVADVLKLPPSAIAANTAFSRLGVDSIVGIELTNRIRQDFAPIPSTALFELTCIAQIAAYLERQYPNDVAKFLDQTPSSSDVRAAVPSAPQQEVPRITATSRLLQGGRGRPQAAVSAAAGYSTAALAHEPIAIIGLSGQFPQAATLEQFWHNLTNGHNGITPVPAERWDGAAEVYQNANGEDIAANFGGFLPDIDMFDARFFHLSATEAASMSPEERLFLQSVWHLLEDAGYTRTRLAELETNADAGVGVFVGAMYQHYPFLAANAHEGAALATSANWAIANRVSHFLNIHGPSVAIDTACSSSLMAVHMAVQSVRSGECVAAIAGGVNLSLHPGKFAGLIRSNLLSAGDISAPLGDSDGMLPGEGVGAVMLKPLSKAQADGDNIWGLILASAANHGGHTTHFRVPGTSAQTKLIAKVISQANVPVQSIGYYDLAANGAPLGDAAEIAALQEAFSSLTEQKDFCALGSVKSNIGHLEACSGISQLAKSLLQLRHKTLVPSLFNKGLNPNISLEDSAFYLQDTLTAWDANGPRRCAVSSVGAGGSNVQMVLQEAPMPVQVNSVVPEPQLVMLSASSEEALLQFTLNLREHLLTRSEAVADIAYSLRIGRESKRYRLACLAKDTEQFLAQLWQYISQQASDEDTSSLQANGIYLGNSQEYAVIAPLVSGESGEALIAHLQSQAEWAKLAWFWVRGLDLNWQTDKRGNLVSLPGTVFEKRRCWINDTSAASIEPSAPLTNTGVSSPKISAGQRISDIDYLRANREIDGALEFKFADIVVDIRIMAAEVLGFNTSEIDVQESMADYGLNSLQAVKLKNALENHFGVSLSLAEFFAQPNIEACAVLLLQRLHGKHSNWREQSERLLAADTQLLEPLILPLLQGQFDLREISTALITGASGFLGAHLLHQCLKQFPNTKLICLVRRTAQQKPKERLINRLKNYKLWREDFEERIKVIEADISRPQLGLADSQWKRLSQEVDVIFHAAAQVNHVSSYANLRPTNVLSLLELIRLATAKKLKAINFVSSVAVNIRLDEGRLKFVGEDQAITHFTGLVSGYAQSKWMGETLLLQAAQQGLPVYIFRPAEITASSQSGSGEFDDIFHRFAELFFDMSDVPQWSSASLDFLPVDTVAQLICAACGSSFPTGWIANLSHPAPVHLSELLNWYQEHTGQTQTYLPLPAWCDAAREYIQLHNSPAMALLMEWLKNEGDLPLFCLYFSTSQFELLNQHRLQALADIEIPALNANLFRRLFTHLINTQVSLDVI